MWSPAWSHSELYLGTPDMLMIATSLLPSPKCTNSPARTRLKAKAEIQTHFTISWSPRAPPGQVQINSEVDKFLVMASDGVFEEGLMLQWCRIALCSSNASSHRCSSRGRRGSSSSSSKSSLPSSLPALYRGIVALVRHKEV